MTTHLERDLDALRQSILTLGGLVEAAVRDATESVVRRLADQARQVIAADEVVDAHEIQIDDECVKLLALHQPVAGDLRFIASVMKINNDLERTGDLAKNVAECALALADLPVLNESLQIEAMTERVRRMLRQALDALVERNTDLARSVIADDDSVDEMNARHFEVLERRMTQDPTSVRPALQLLSVSRNLERIADLATNIAEDVIFLVEAQDIRHLPLSKGRSGRR